MPEAWLEANQRRLALEFARIHAILKQRLAQSDTPDVGGAPVEDATPMKAPSAIDSLVTAFGLSDFERDVVLLCAGAELSADISALLEGVRGDSPMLTFRLLLALLPGAHWSATTPAGALRSCGNCPTRAMATITASRMRPVWSVLFPRSSSRRSSRALMRVAGAGRTSTATPALALRGP